MKKATAIMLVFLLLLGVFAGCGKKDSAENPTGVESASAQQTEAPEGTTQKDSYVDSIDYTTENGTLKFVRFEKARGGWAPEGNAYIFIFEFTNNQSQPAGWNSTFFFNFYQNGVEVEDIRNYNYSDDEQYSYIMDSSKSVMKGATLTFGDGVVFPDNSPVTIEVKAFSSSGSLESQMMEIDLNGSDSNPSAATDSTAAATTESKDEIKTLKLGETIETEDFKYTLNSVEFTVDIIPSDTSGFYSHYEADSGKVYIRLDSTYYNRSKRNVCVRDLPKIVADYDNGYTYNGSSIVDDGDGSWTWVSSYIVCEPLNTCVVTGMIECPEVVESSSAPLKILITLGDQVYQYDVRA